MEMKQKVKSFEEKSIFMHLFEDSYIFSSIHCFEHSEKFVQEGPTNEYCEKVVRHKTEKPLM
jgi:hypothetical protein